MLEVKVIIAAPELAGAINNLATVISGKVPQTQSVPEAQASAATPVPVQPDAPVAAPIATPAPVAAPIPVQPQPPATPVANVPVADAPQFTHDQIMTAGAALMDAGKIDDLLNLLRSFGVQAVTELKPEQLGAFATEMRKLGAAI